MIVGAYVRRAAPDHPAGAEYAMLDTLAFLAERGHDCRVLSETGHTRGRVDGVLVYSQPTADEAAQHFADCDVVLTHLEAIQDAQFLAADSQTPLVHLVHSAGQLERLGVLPGCSALAVFNSTGVAEACSWWRGAGMILHPPIREERVKATPGACISLVNMSHEKGALRFLSLAASMTRHPFLGVMGAYGDQALTTDGIPGHGDNPLSAPLPGNMRVVPATPAIGADVFAFTRVLLVLSRNETYGRIAGEALVSGIPVVATRSPGLEECCGAHAEYLDQNATTDALSKTIARVYGDDWPQFSAEATSRARYNRSRSASEIEGLEQHLHRIAADAPAMTLSTAPHP